MLIVNHADINDVCYHFADLHDKGEGDGMHVAACVKQDSGISECDMLLGDSVAFVFACLDQTSTNSPQRRILKANITP